MRGCVWTRSGVNRCLIFFYNSHVDIYLWGGRDWPGGERRYPGTLGSRSPSP